MIESRVYRKTPAMGWASWNCFRTDISEEKIKEQADAIVKTGLAECGYQYIIMDDGFFGGRDERGTLQFHATRFPNGIKPVAEYIHNLGLKAGIYTEGGDKTCGYYYDNEAENGDNVGLYQHEEQDLRLYLEECGFDYIKVDWCGGLRLGLNEREQYTKIGKIIDEIRHETGRSIVYNICRWQFPGVWATTIADSWRTGADIAPNFMSVLHQIDIVKPLARYCMPGHFNDLDMMQIGNGMSVEEDKTHFTMWCMLSTPLMIGCDLTAISDVTMEILKNKEMIAINQDSACLQAFVVKEIREIDGTVVGEVWVKDLGRKNSNKKAIAFLNRQDTMLEMTFDLCDAGLIGRIISIRNLWSHENLDCRKTLTVRLCPHEAAAFMVKSEKSIPVANPDDKGDFKAYPIKRINRNEMEEMVKNGAFLVDVRTPAEYARNHLPNAINIPYTDIHAVAGERIKGLDTPIITYCATGKRSVQAITTLGYLGYKNICFLGSLL